MSIPEGTVLAPTPRLRWVLKPSTFEGMPPEKVLQCYWAQDVPGYMRAQAVGKWYDVEVEPLGHEP